MRIQFYGPSQTATRCRSQGRYSSNSKTQCDTLIFGSLVKHFLSNALWPGTPAKLASAMPGTSVKNLSELMDAFKCDEWPSSSYESHSSCVLASQLSDATRAVLGEMSSGMLESHVKHMEVQHLKLNQPTSLLKRVQVPPLLDSCPQKKNHK